MREHDVIVVGGGGAGLRAAVAAHEAGADVAIVSKLHPVRSHTGAAEGGINAAFHERDSPETHAYDTMKGADYLADAPAVEALCRETPKEVIQLERWGMSFSRNDAGEIDLRYLAGHSAPRTTYAGAETGHHLLHTLYQQVVKRGITIYDEYYVLSLAVTDVPNPDDRRCHGVVAYDLATGSLEGFRADGGVVLATGGLGQVYNHTTNAVSNTGDGVAMAYRAGAAVQDMEFVQFHPTTLPSTGVLISEGVRGEGGVLYNRENERFMFERGYANNAGELASRDVVSRAELFEIQDGRGFDDDHVHLDMRHIGEGRIRDRLENIIHLAEDFEGVDPTAEPMPVKPGQHFAMGGIETDEYGQTSIEGLYAAGECACASVHGSNRLGGNALPELIVFGKRAGERAASDDPVSASIPTGAEARTRTWGGSIDAPIGDPEPDPLTAMDGGRADESTVDDSPAAVVSRAVERERRRIDRLMQRDGTNHAVIRSTLQRAFEEHVNVFRTRSGLESTLETLARCRRQYQEVGVSDPSHTFNTDLIQTIETRNMLDVAEAITIGAFVREEFRGAHWRLNHQTRDDEEWLRHTYVTWNGGRPAVHFGPVLLRGEMRTYEPKVRSY
ncbi:FAD-binding protein [Halorubrum vacuolatum]|uniref:succinate dehydrogenase n=1 Tax=Halorubrum vacuolatum TaxID=63740 RepID=A0A238WYD8_HALVU|nr:FAD-binding protein [Halorubrum vacuolatum]SNR51438.1 succinate dehydrogenase subunit A [Halorubrum vacuolatum]